MISEIKYCELKYGHTSVWNTTGWKADTQRARDRYLRTYFSIIRPVWAKQPIRWPCSTAKWHMVKVKNEESIIIVGFARYPYARSTSLAVWYDIHIVDAHVHIIRGGINQFSSPCSTSVDITFACQEFFRWKMRI